MTTLEIQTQLSFESLLNSLQQLEASELDRLAKETSLIRARKRAPNLTLAETQLLEKIQSSQIPIDVRERCAALTAKQENKPLLASEKQELVGLIDQMEMINAQRMGHLLSLANLRQISLDEVMDQLEIKPLSYG